MSKEIELRLDLIEKRLNFLPSIIMLLAKIVNVDDILTTLLKGKIEEGRRTEVDELLNDLQKAK